MGKIIQKIEFILENVDVIIFNKEDIDIMFITNNVYVSIENIHIL